jgi:hypothetical protein
MIGCAMSSPFGPDASAWLAARDDGGAAIAALGRLLDAPGDAYRLVASDTTCAVAALHALRDPGTLPHTVAASALGLAAALARPAAPQVEHAPAPSGVTSRPLLDHAVTALTLLAALERGDATFVPAAHRARVLALLDALRAASALPMLRLAMLHLDVAKGGTDDDRQAWVAAGVNLDIHNLGAEDLLRDTGALSRWPLDRAQQAAVTTLVAQHGLAGQCVRGEVPPALLPAIAPALADALHVIDLCDTAAVRPGLLDDRITDGLHAVLRQRRGERAPEAPLADRLRGAAARPHRGRRAGRRRRRRARGAGAVRARGAGRAAGDLSALVRRGRHVRAHAARAAQGARGGLRRGHRDRRPGRRAVARPARRAGAAAAWQRRADPLPRADRGGVAGARPRSPSCSAACARRRSARSARSPPRSGATTRCGSTGRPATRPRRW